ncbi:MAG: hypothetical protein ROW48_13720 [Bellilinea sp.]|jgi:hypothetical protein
MIRRELIAKIIYEFTADEGFLAELRARNFSPRKFEDIILTLQKYKELIQGEEFIERSVAYAVFNLFFELLGAVKYYPQNEQERSMIENALEQFLPLAHEILAPEWMTGPLPDEYK